MRRANAISVLCHPLLLQRLYLEISTLELNESVVDLELDLIRQTEPLSRVRLVFELELKLVDN